MIVALATHVYELKLFFKTEGSGYPELCLIWNTFNEVSKDI
jgi:hypothetical protein